MRIVAVDATMLLVAQVNIHERSGGFRVAASTPVVHPMSHQVCAGGVRIVALNTAIFKIIIGMVIGA